jgi:hypothetical protein
VLLYAPLKSRLRIVSEITIFYPLTRKIEQPLSYFECA